MNRPLEKIGFRVEHEQDGYVLFEKDGIKIYIEMLGKDLEPSIGFAEAEEVTENETKWHYNRCHYSSERAITSRQ